MNAATLTAAAEPVSGVEIFVPLNKLKKSPKKLATLLDRMCVRRIDFGAFEAARYEAGTEMRVSITQIVDPEQRGHHRARRRLADRLCNEPLQAL